MEKLRMCWRSMVSSKGVARQVRWRVAGEAGRRCLVGPASLMGASGEAGGAQVAGVSAERSVVDLGLFGQDGEGANLDFLANPVKKLPPERRRRAAKGHRAAKNDAIGVDGVHQVDRTDTQVTRRVEDEPQRERITRFGFFGQQQGRDFFAIGDAAGQAVRRRCRRGLRWCV